MRPAWMMPCCAAWPGQAAAPPWTHPQMTRNRTALQTWPLQQVGCCTVKLEEKLLCQQGCFALGRPRACAVAWCRCEPGCAAEGQPHQKSLVVLLQSVLPGLHGGEVTCYRFKPCACSRLAGTTASLPALPLRRYRPAFPSVWGACSVACAADFQIDAPHVILLPVSPEACRQVFTLLLFRTWPRPVPPPRAAWSGPQLRCWLALQSKTCLTSAC